jgi:hypothetical protein
MMNLVAPQIARRLASLRDPRIYPKPIYYKDDEDAWECGGRELVGLTVSYGLRHVSLHSKSVLWVEGFVRESGRFTERYFRKDSHANVMIICKIRRLVVVFEPHLAIHCAHIDRVGKLWGGGTQRQLLRDLRKRMAFRVSICFGTQDDTPTCRDECMAFLRRMRAVDFSFEDLELRSLNF